MLEGVEARQELEQALFHYPRLFEQSDFLHASLKKPLDGSGALPQSGFLLETALNSCSCVNLETVIRPLLSICA